MKKYLISGVVVLAFVFYVAYSKGLFKGDEDTHLVPPTHVDVGGVGQYKDGSYTGNVADAFYGPLQVKAVISGGKITDVLFLQYPNDRPNSIEINNAAMPILKAEAIKAQSANVEIVTGATQTAEAFRVTLAAALAQAKN